MIYKGKKLSGPNQVYVVLLRNDEEIVFKCQAVLSFEEFRKLCPEPKAPTIVKRGEGVVEDIENPVYKEAVRQYQKRRLNWMILKSLEATEDLKWETVDSSNSDTWENYDKELKESGFGEYDINRIISGVMEANSLDERKLEQARKAFLASNIQNQPILSSQEAGLSVMQSGPPANGSVSDHPT